jgi:hypothetical protein
MVGFPFRSRGVVPTLPGPVCLFERKERTIQRFDEARYLVSPRGTARVIDRPGHIGETF